jgi:hypothetical protein
MLGIEKQIRIKRFVICREWDLIPGSNDSRIQKRCWTKRNARLLETTCKADEEDEAFVEALKQRWRRRPTCSGVLGGGARGL